MALLQGCKNVGGDLIPEPVSADTVFAQMLRSYN